jgi:hypothetical protein
MPYKRGTRLDKMPNGKYRLILFGNFTHSIQSQEINNVTVADITEIYHQIDGFLQESIIQRAARTPTA